MLNEFSRTELLIGKDNLEKLKKSKVAVFGIGGVGSFVAEALARSGIEELVLIDYDKVDITNLNRQIFASHKTIGKYKVDVMKERILDINPNSKVEIYKDISKKDLETEIIDKTFDYVVDAVDTIKTKIDLIIKCNELNVPIISSMGTANKLDPTRFEITDIYKTSVCPLSKVIRKELKKRDIKKLKVIYSKEEPIKVEKREDSNLGSIAFVPSVAGLMIAGEVVKDIIEV